MADTNQTASPTPQPEGYWAGVWRRTRLLGAAANSFVEHTGSGLIATPGYIADGANWATGHRMYSGSAGDSSYNFIMGKLREEDNDPNQLAHALTVENMTPQEQRQVQNLETGMNVATAAVSVVRAAPAAISLARNVPSLLRSGGSLLSTAGDAITSAPGSIMRLFRAAEPAAPDFSGAAVAGARMAEGVTPAADVAAGAARTAEAVTPTAEELAAQEAAVRAQWNVPHPQTAGAAAAAPEVAPAAAAAPGAAPGAAGAAAPAAANAGAATTDALGTGRQLGLYRTLDIVRDPKLAVDSKIDLLMRGGRSPQAERIVSEIMSRPITESTYTTIRDSRVLYTTERGREIQRNVAQAWEARNLTDFWRLPTRLSNWGAQSSARAGYLSSAPIYALQNPLYTTAAASRTVLPTAARAVRDAATLPLTVPLLPFTRAFLPNALRGGATVAAAAGVDHMTGSHLLDYGRSAYSWSLREMGDLVGWGGGKIGGLPGLAVQGVGGAFGLVASGVAPSAQAAPAPSAPGNGSSPSTSRTDFQQSSTPAATGNGVMDFVINNWLPVLGGIAGMATGSGIGGRLRNGAFGALGAGALEWMMSSETGHKLTHGLEDDFNYYRENGHAKPGGILEEAGNLIGGHPIMAAALVLGAIMGRDSIGSAVTCAIGMALLAYVIEQAMPGSKDLARNIGGSLTGAVQSVMHGDLVGARDGVAAASFTGLGAAASMAAPLLHPRQPGLLTPNAP